MKGNTTITISDDKIDINTKSNISLNAKNIVVGGENTIKGQTLLQWLNKHTHSNGNNGSATGAPIDAAEDTLLVKE